MRLLQKMSTWVDLPDDTDGARMKVCNLSHEERANIAQKSTEIIPREYLGRVVPIPAVNGLRHNQLVAVAAVEDWEGFLDADGKEMECSTENKKTWACDPDFSRFVQEQVDLLDKQAAALVAEKRKN